jgi:hypothetical protein
MKKRRQLVSFDWAVKRLLRNRKTIGEQAKDLEEEEREIAELKRRSNN